MARTGAGSLQCRRNSKLDSFLKRNTERGVYERIRAYEPCVVISGTVNKVYMHVVLSDDCVYLTEYRPRTLTSAVTFYQIRDIELVNDLPDFLSGKDRERSQHIRIIYGSSKPSGNEGLTREGRLESLPALGPRSHRPSLAGVSEALLSAPEQSRGWRISPEPMMPSREEEEETHMLRTTRSASCPTAEVLGLRRTLNRPSLNPPSPALSLSPTAPLSPTSPLSPVSDRPPDAGLGPRRRGSALARLLRRERGTREKDGAEGEKELDLHLYSVSPTSHIYLHLQSSWNSYIIRSTLLFDPLYRRRCGVSSTASPQKPPAISWERTAQLFCQLSREMLQEDISLESLYLLLQELCTAAHRNITLRKLFWRSSDICPFLVRTLEDSIQSCHKPEVTHPGLPTADQLLLCTLLAQTLALMFRETEIEPARFSLLTAKQGALTARLLLALVCDPKLRSSNRSPKELVSPPHTELGDLFAEYLDAACSLMFELVVLCQEACRCPSLENFLTVGWILKVLQSHSSLLSFVGYQAQQVVLVLSGPEPLSPAQGVMLFQRCRVLLACLQCSSHLAQHLRTEFREEFKYYVRLSSLKEKLPSQYPISKPVQRLVSQLLGLILQTT